ncbi:hypothetical protein ACFSJ3_05715 [Corallincola platygyrae]|uniref:Lipoprotein n=1 Tax=Corallincola platygyrae TaxID=1193278 RepID=A0ABW4XIW2_9GAMM
MRRNFLAIFTLGLLVVACGSTQKHVSTKSVERSPAPMMKLLPVSFSDEVASGKFKAECSMLQVLNDSIIENSANVTLSSDASGYALEVSFVEVVPHRWVFGSVRPSSSATFIASVTKDGQTIDTTKKTIGSAVAFGACDRLEKIALASGRYVAKWIVRK